MGFCLFNNVAVGALHARAAHGLKRVAVVDFDVHHGNGTQDIFWADPDLFYASTHQMPLYPGTGSASERGTSGNVLNRPLPAGKRQRQSSGRRMRTLFFRLSRGSLRSSSSSLPGSTHTAPIRWRT